jgi:hypothetical protein
MNTYRAVRLETGRWAVEWTADGAVVGCVPGTFDTEVEAYVAAFNLTRLEWAEAPRPIPRTTKP